MAFRCFPLPSHLRVLVAAGGICIAATAVDAGAREGPGAHRFVAPRAAARQAERGQGQRAPRGQERAQERAPEPVAAPIEAAPEAAPARPGRPGRLTPDERRALRQQINDANRDIYQPGRP